MDPGGINVHVIAQVIDQANWEVNDHWLVTKVKLAKGAGERFPESLRDHGKRNGLSVPSRIP
jgi:hypothetical protein